MGLFKWIKDRHIKQVDDYVTLAAGKVADVIASYYKEHNLITVDNTEWENLKAYWDANHGSTN